MKLQEFRKNAGWSCRHLAKVINERLGTNYTQGSVTNWEHGIMPRADVHAVISELSGGLVTVGDYYA